MFSTFNIDIHTAKRFTHYSRHIPHLLIKADFNLRFFFSFRIITGVTPKINTTNFQSAVPPIPEKPNQLCNANLVNEAQGGSNLDALRVSIYLNDLVAEVLHSICLTDVILFKKKKPFYYPPQVVFDQYRGIYGEDIYLCVQCRPRTTHNYSQ